MIRYAIFGLPRTGSSLLGAILAGQASSVYDREVLHPHHWRGWHRLPYRFLHLYPYPYLNYRQRAARRQGGRLYGFKLFPQHVGSPRPVLLELDRQGWRILHIQRRNLFDQVLSALVARHTGRFNGAHTDAVPRLFLDPAMVACAMGERRQRILEVDEILRAIEHIDVVYEDDLSDPSRWDAMMGRIAAAWGIPFAPAQTSYQKTWQQPYAEMVANYAELRLELEAHHP